ncbi:hypothetical protein ACOJBO_39890 [Rhizobium beringeri]
MQLNLRQSLEKAHQPINFVYFFEEGLGSVVASKEGGSTVEVGLFGRDGMTGTSLVQGDTEARSTASSRWAARRFVFLPTIFKKRCLRAPR